MQRKQVRNCAFQQKVEHGQKSGERQAGRGRGRYLDTRDAADYLGVSESFLCKARHFGSGPGYVRLGRAVRYPVDALETWAADRLVVPAANGSDRAAG